MRTALVRLKRHVFAADRRFENNMEDPVRIEYAGRPLEESWDEASQDICLASSRHLLVRLARDNDRRDTDRWRSSQGDC